MNPPTPPLLERSGGCVEVGEWNVEAVSKCRSELSKRRFAWLLLCANRVEAVEAGRLRMSKSVSKECRSPRTSTREREGVGKRFKDAENHQARRPGSGPLRPIQPPLSGHWLSGPTPRPQLTEGQFRRRSYGRRCVGPVRCSPPAFGPRNTCCGPRALRPQIIPATLETSMGAIAGMPVNLLLIYKS
jgi:hypothetical protein